MSKIVKLVGLIAATCVACACIEAEERSDQGELAVLLQWFLDGVDKKETHDAFWAEDLVYTSSDGTRFGKDEIMSGFDGDAEDDGAEVAPVSYAAEDVDIRVFDDTAVLTFTLLGIPADGAGIQYYLNSGTFRKRDDKWQVIVWQATKKALAE